MSSRDEKNLKVVYSIKNLRVEYTETPLGIDVEFPRFSWQMDAPVGERGYSQTAYQIIVKDQKGRMVWDTDKIVSDSSLNILYSGSPLKACTRYNWTVTVWNQKGDGASDGSWFETGLMNPEKNLSAWDGAVWIGGSEEDLVLYSQYLSVFKVAYSLELHKDSTKASFVLGANDSRLMDKNKNIYNIASSINENYIKFELDISEVDGTEKGLAKVKIYRVGYHPEDSLEKPIISINIPSKLINFSNRYKSHDIYLWCNLGVFTIYIDGTEDKNNITKNSNPNSMPWEDDGVNVNPVGHGNNYISYPMAADIGFAVNADQKASFRNVKLYNYRLPSNVLFQENLKRDSNTENYEGIYSSYAKDENSGFIIENNGYVLTGGDTGVFVVANPSHNSMPMLRTEFEVDEKEIQSARLYVTARGIYEMYINGKRVGEDYFNPGSTQYNKTHMYQTYDVTDMLNVTGGNAIGTMLGEGWWSGAITFTGENWNYFGDRQSLLAKLVITYSDGTTQKIITNPDDWKYYNDGPLVYGSFFQGEVYDALKETAVKGWNKAGYEDHLWRQAVEIPINTSNAFIGSMRDLLGEVTDLYYDDMSLIGQIGQNAGVVTILTAKSVEEVRKGIFVYDMGQNMAGIPRVIIKNGTSGDRLTLRFAEVKYPDMREYGENIGMIMLENIRAALSQDIYILKGGDEIIQPRFTFHGYRFIEITGVKNALPLEAVQGVVISSITKLASSYETSNPKVNRLWENIVWSQRDNFISIPTDCPQRNERLGWSGDISVYSRTANYIAHADLFLTRHMYAMRDVQKPNGKFTDIAPLGGGFGGVLWGSAGITVPWEVYQQYGDAGILQQHYDAMKKYVSYLDTKIDAEKGFITEEIMGLGDWLGPENNKNEPVFLWSAYHVYDLWIMAKTAEILGKAADAEQYWIRYMERKMFFNNRFVEKESHKTVKSDGVTLIDTQTSYAVPLALGVFSDDKVPFAAKHLADACRRENEDDDKVKRPPYSLMTGFIGTAWISKALSDNGYDAVAYRMIQQTSYPSWLYSIDHGATTIWERLNSYTMENGFGGNNSMNSFNHYSFGAVGAWMYNYSLGIQRDEENPGFKRFILQPTPDPDGVMTWAKGYYDSEYGRIYSEWKQEKDKVSYKVTVPANTTAKIYLSAASEDYINENGKPAAEAEGVTFIKNDAGKAIFELQSGNYEFSTCIK